MPLLKASIVPTAIASQPLVVPAGTALRPGTGGSLSHLSCKRIRIIYFMRGFLPQPSSDALKHCVVIAKLNDTTSATVLEINLSVFR